ncbi:CPBP family intramembrane metalloprotease [Bradyrhizobium genosp. L]|uniref:CPBP family intramembrane glutamic endopeptidase n=1 Tax=Bradyrhizobium genosp. L TaxID=83637 RepID=UPI0018A2DB4A|nr:type II CAAX endopeptidase family protein [Bradyrhizobium genosp. L]QPF83317.1 CPBP family intramembrane metalloprotease [Bradyrhizobium genosp. L]
MSEAVRDGSVQPAGLWTPAGRGGWREGAVVLAIVLAPVGLAVILTTAAMLALVIWQLQDQGYVDLPTPANIRLLGMLCYVAGSWIAVVAAWFWSQRRGMRRDVFIFRRLTWPAAAASLVGLVIAVYGAPAATHWLSHALGGGGPGVRINLHSPYTTAVYLLVFVITSPLCEEVLYRGLLVAWLRRVGWHDVAIWLVGSLIFGANHVIALGVAWSIVMVAFGAILFALRMRHGSLTPAWLTHLLFNAQPFLILPLINKFAPALHPGVIS